MTPEERRKHPNYEQVLKQYEQMDSDEKARTQEAAAKLREYMKYSVALFLGTPTLGFEYYRHRMITHFGPIPTLSQWQLVTYNHLCTMYDTIYNSSSHKAPHVTAALQALSQLLPRSIDGPAPAVTERAFNVYRPEPPTNNQLAPPPPPPKQQDQHQNQHEHQHVNEDGGGGGVGTMISAHKGGEPDLSTLPRELQIICNGQAGTFVVRTQTIYCHCAFCAETAAENNRHRLELSVCEFERHAGLGYSKRWRFTIRLLNPSMTLGTWLDENRFPVKYIEATEDDGILLRAEAKKREVVDVAHAAAAAGETSKSHALTPHDYENQLQQLTQSKMEEGEQRKGGGGASVRPEISRDLHTASAAPLPPTSILATAAAVHQNNTKRKRKKAQPPSAQPPVQSNRNGNVTPPFYDGSGAAFDGNEDAEMQQNLAIGRSQRQRKKPTWMRQAVDPNAVLGGRGPGQNFSAAVMAPEDAYEDAQTRKGGPRGGIAATTTHHHHHTDGLAGRKRARINTEALLEAEIDGALARGLQPELHGWRINDSNQLAVTVYLGGVVFSGVLPARPLLPGTTPPNAAAAAAYLQPAPPPPPPPPQQKQQKQVAPPPPKAKAKAQALQTPVEGRYDSVNRTTGDIIYINDDDVDGGDGGTSIDGALPPPPPTALRALNAGLGVLSPGEDGLGINNGRAALGGGAVGGSGSGRGKNSSGGGGGGGGLRGCSGRGNSSTGIAAPRTAPGSGSGGGRGAVGVYNLDVPLSTTEKELRIDERRAMAAAEYERFLVTGPPPESTCAMCHLGEIDKVPQRVRGPTGKSQVGLGELVLIRASTITNAWVHDQCARWSPDVYDPTGEGLLEGIPAAVRRGRMLRCKVCNEKGATLGCLKKTCKSSYHLRCARLHGCLLNIEPYAVACPEHVDQLPDGLSQILGFKRGQKMTPPSGSGGGGGGDALERGRSGSVPFSGIGRGAEAFHMQYQDGGGGEEQEQYYNNQQQK